MLPIRTKVKIILSSDKANLAMSEKEKRDTMIADEMKAILKGAAGFVMEHYEEDEFEPEAAEALRKAASILAYRKKYYNVVHDRVVYFPSVGRLILKADLMEEAEKHYYDEHDEWPIVYTKALKSVIRAIYATNSTSNNGMDEDEDEDYMEKLATDVEIQLPTDEISGATL